LRSRFFSLFHGKAQSGSLVSISELPAALAKAHPGELLLIRNGTYPDRQLSLSGSGQKDQSITLRAETPGGVILSGRSSIRIDGDWITLDGVLFSDGFSPRKEVISLSGSHCRLVNCVIDNYNPPDPDTDEKWVSLRGHHHVVEYCTFQNKRSRGVTLTVWRDGNQADRHIILRNYFLDRPKGSASNGYETIRIGTSDTSASDSLTAISENLFQRCDGEMEIISVKSGKNLIRDNTFLECAGTLTLRHGNGSVVERNLFIGNRKKGTGGIRIFGAGHLIKDNSFIGTTGRAEAAIALMCGNPDPAPHEFEVARSIRIEGNLIAANEGPALKFDTKYKSENRTQLPEKILIRANTLSGSEPATLVSGATILRPGAVTWDRNQIFQQNQIPSTITGKIAPPLNPADVGAPWFRGKVRK